MSLREEQTGLPAAAQRAAGERSSPGGQAAITKELVEIVSGAEAL
jgi:hypothetical protein